MTDDAAHWPRPAAGVGPVVALGKLVCDQVLRLSAPLVAGDQQRVARSVSAGGAPANVCASLARLGVPCRFAGWAGADPLADSLLASLADRGVELSVVRRGRAPVTTVLVHPDGDRTLLADRGDGELLVPDVESALLTGAAVLHLDGFDLLRFPDALIAAASMARAAGVPASVDMASAARMRDVGPAGYLSLLAELQAEALFCNAAEATVLGLDDPLPDWAPDLVLVHAGAEPTRVLTRAGSWSVPVEPLPVEHLVDTTGCGDAFAAGVLAGWRGGAAVLDAVHQGHAAAAVIAGVVGAQP